MPEPPRRRYWGCVRTALLKADFTIVENGDAEGAATFDPRNSEQAKAAIRAAGIKRKRRITQEQRDKQIARLRASAGKAPSVAGTRTKPKMMERDVTLQVRAYVAPSGEIGERLPTGAKGSVL